MGWRTVAIDSPCKLTYKNEYLLIRADKDSLVYIPEIDSLIISTTQCVITAILLNELIKNKVNVVFCDEKHNPVCNTLAFYGCHNSSKKIANQISWTTQNKEKAFTAIIKQKIINQAKLLRKIDKLTESEMLFRYAEEIQPNDRTNREGFAAKVYFNALFGMDFTREGTDKINSALNYGYTVLLSCFNREVVAAGYLTQLGVRHCNEFNNFNYSCDLIEPFRVIVDDFVFHSPPLATLDSEYKHRLIELTQVKIYFGREYYLTDAIGIFVRKMSEAINSGDVESVKIYEF